MRSIVVDHASPGGYMFGEVEEPLPAPGRAVVAVRHASLNHGDLNDARSGRLGAGAVLGSDAAGSVVVAATDGSGPPVGARVVALVAGAFAPRVAAEVGALAEVPAAVDLAASAALPVAGLAALQSLRRGRSGPGRRVLVTGASGGVGRYAVQLAAGDGAQVIAAVGSRESADRLGDVGANQVVVGADGLDALEDQVDVVIDTVGGSTLVQAWGLLAPGGDLQSVGWASGKPAVFPPYATIGPQRSLTAFLIGGDVGADLGELVTRLGDGSLAVEVGWRGPWERVAEAAEAMEGRTLQGKAILDIAGDL